LLQLQAKKILKYGDTLLHKENINFILQIILYYEDYERGGDGDGGGGGGGGGGGEGGGSGDFEMLNAYNELYLNQFIHLTFIRTKINRCCKSQPDKRGGTN
jgi:hypothetical protein